MSNKVYYGEYSLKHWINLILSGNITLPDYQRSFVWSQEQVQRLIQAFQEDLYVPPVTIGVYQSDDGSSNNWVLDGQQRLTSILLAYLEIFPNRDKFGKKVKIDKSDKQSDEVEDSDNENPNEMEWTFKKIQEEIKKNNIRKVKDYFQNLPNSKDYKKLDIQIDDFEEFLENHYLGFSFLIPQSNNKDNENLEKENDKLRARNETLKTEKTKMEGEQEGLSKDDDTYRKISKNISTNKSEQKINNKKIKENTEKIKENIRKERNRYYISIFRAINIEGESLSDQENREALYYLDDKLKSFFDPNFISNYTLKTRYGTQKIDFIRYLSIISQSKTMGSDFILLNKDKKPEKLEQFYAKYVYSIVDNKDSDTFGQKLNYFSDKEFQDRLDSIEKYLSEMFETKDLPFESIIYVDLVMFGLINNVLFGGIKLNSTKFKILKEKISQSYTEFRKNNNHYRNPKHHKYTKLRFSKSMDIYKEIFDESA